MEYKKAKIFADIVQKHAGNALIVGSLRRKQPIVSDIDILVVVKNPGDIRRAQFICTATDSSIKIMGVDDCDKLNSELQQSIARQKVKKLTVDIFYCTIDELPFAVYHHTGSKEYNIRVRAHAKEKGWLLNQYGLFNRLTGFRVRGSTLIKTEADLMKFIGVSDREPWDR